MNEPDFHVYFNGIDGRTGRYAIEPKPLEDFYEHIVDQQRASPDLTGALQTLSHQRADEIQALVRFLAETALAGGAEDAAAWRAELARLLAENLLDPAYHEGRELAALERRLARHTVDKLVAIVAALVEKDDEALHSLLLVDQDVAPDNLMALKERLKQDARRKIDWAQAWLAPTCPGDGAWRAGWMDALRDLPVDAIGAIGVLENSGLRNIVLRLRRDLSRRLETWAEVDAEAAAWIAPLREALDALETRVAWEPLVDAVDQGLRAMLPVDDQTRWARLLDVLRRWLDRLAEAVGRFLGVMEGIDPQNLAEAGWALILPYPESPQAAERQAAIKAALAPLLRRRQAQAGERFHIYEGPDGYRPNDTARSFLTRHGGNPAKPVDPREVPYYLLIVGGPEEIPYHVQYQLDVQYAVGRLDFDAVEDYAHYARSVVAAEASLVRLAPRAAFFGVAHPDDPMTQQSAEKLIAPLADAVEGQALGDRTWAVARAMRDAATKDRLLAWLGAAAPAFLFTASHGMAFDQDDACQWGHQGALLCQDWAGTPGEVPTTSYVSGDDVAEDANLLGLIAFFFACFSAGTPRHDAYYKRAFLKRGETIAPCAFTAALPRALLRLRSGGALAVIGHVDRAFGMSFTRTAEASITAFQSVVEALLKGKRVGLALEHINERHAALSTELTAAYEALDGFGPQPDKYEVATMWTANNDARGYIILGDPAVRLPIAATEAEATGRPDLTDPDVQARLDDLLSGEI